VHRGQQVNRPCGCDHDPFVFGHLHFKGMYVKRYQFLYTNMDGEMCIVDSK
jgi:hypothetical protein